MTASALTHSHTPMTFTMWVEGENLTRTWHTLHVHRPKCTGSICMYNTLQWGFFTFRQNPLRDWLSVVNKDSFVWSEGRYVCTLWMCECVCVCLCVPAPVWACNCSTCVNHYLYVSELRRNEACHALLSNSHHSPFSPSLSFHLSA